MLREADGPIFSFEFFPPRSPEGEEVLLETVGVLKELGPGFVSVTYGAGGTTRDKTIEVVSRIRAEFELEAMPHLTCVNATVDDLRRTLDEMGEAGVENVLALRGDPPRGQERWTKTEGGLEYSRELVALVRDEYDFTIGGAAFPETHIHASSADDDVRHLKAKVEAGATFLITQMFFDNRFYFDFVERAREAGVEVPIIPGVMPILSSEGIRRMAELSAAHLPPELVHELEARHGNDEAVADLGLSFATLQCAELLAGGAPGIHFCTLNRTPATRAVLSALQLMRPWKP